MPEVTTSGDPYIRKGVDKGRLKEEFAHDLFNSIDAAYDRTKKRDPNIDKHTFFDREGYSDLLIGQISKRIKLEKELQEALTVDELTGLLSPQAYLKVVEEIIKEGNYHSVGLIRLDLDHFSWVNDITGHYFGDRYLATVGKIIASGLRSGRDLGFRTSGGDEFAVFVRDSFSAESSNMLTQRLYRSLHKTVLPMTLDMLQNSHREIDIAGGKRDREGTFAFKQFLEELNKLKNNTGGKRTHFESLKGTPEQKREVLKKLDSVDLTKFQAYLDDARTFRELDDGEKGRRLDTERRLANIISDCLLGMDISLGAVYVSKDNNPAFSEMNKQADTLVNDIKAGGGGKYNWVRHLRTRD